MRAADIRSCAHRRGKEACKFTRREEREELERNYLLQTVRAGGSHLRAARSELRRVELHDAIPIFAHTGEVRRHVSLRAGRSEKSWREITSCKRSGLAGRTCEPHGVSCGVRNACSRHTVLRTPAR